jgi:hypothetical protein
MQPSAAESWDPILKERINEAHNSTFDLRNARAVAQATRPKQHLIVKRGPHVVCTSCPNHHAQYIGNYFRIELNEQGERVIVK